MNSTLGSYFSEGVPTIDKLPSLVIKEENCRDMDKLETCIVQELETCKESTPANLVEALFRFVRKETPCIKYAKQKATPNGSDVAKLSTYVIVGTWVMATVAKVLISSQ